jgi:nicotinamidase-related amidase
MAQRTALLVMDVQPAIVARFGDDPGLLDRIRAAIAAARARQMLVVYVVVGFRPDAPEISPNNRTFSQAAGSFDPASAVPAPELGARDDEPVVVKKRVSAFVGSDLEVLLRSQSVSHLYLCGIATSGVVLATLIDAADRDFGLTVLHDACTDADPDVHRVLTEKLFPRRADVLSVAEFAAQS